MMVTLGEPGAEDEARATPGAGGVQLPMMPAAEPHSVVAQGTVTGPLLCSQERLYTSKQ